MHDLQIRFLTPDGEENWEIELRDLFQANRLDDAHAVLSSALAGIDSELARLCLAAAPESVTIAGWPELIEAIQDHQGEPITGATLAIANESDRAFEKGQMHHPFMMLGLYTDEAFAFSEATREALLAQMSAGEGPQWAGLDEDIEVYLDVAGLNQLNTALLHHKQRHYFREAGDAGAPLRYVEYVLGCWWRALLFQQAVATECAIHGLPGGIPVIAGLVDMRPELVAVHGIGARTPDTRRQGAVQECAPMLAADFIQLRPVEEMVEVSGSDLRRRVAETGQEAEEPKRGLLARVFGR